LERKNDIDYQIDEKGKSKLYHANLLKTYYRGACVSLANIPDVEDLNVIPKSPLTVQFCLDEALDENPHLPLTPDGHESDELLSFLSVSSDLDKDKTSDVKILLKEFSDVFSELPGCTETMEHDIILASSDKLRAKVYPVPIHLQPHFEKEVDDLLE